MKIVLPCLLVFLMACIPSLAQDITSHKWQNRVLIVLANDKDSEILKNQISIFQKNLLGLEERKLTIYLATPGEYSIYNPSGLSWTAGNSLYSDFKLRDSEIELVLIGLDGQIKHRKYSLTLALEIFVIIDGMPMRQSELKNRKKQN